VWYKGSDQMGDRKKKEDEKLAKADKGGGERKGRKTVPKREAFSNRVRKKDLNKRRLKNGIRGTA